MRVIWQQRWVWMALGLVLVAGCGTIITPPPSPTPTSSSLSPATGPTSTAAAVLLTPIPPTPTFTPSPTPTPVMHLVESGDTLFGVSLEYGITLDALLAANGLDVDDYLRIGQGLIIPLDTESESIGVEGAVPASILLLPTPTPLPLETSGLSLYRTTMGDIWCMGEVVNTTANPVTDLQLQVTLVDGLGTPLVSGVTLAASDYLPGGACAPFAILFREPPPEASDMSVTLLRAESIGAITAGFVPLTVSGLEGQVSGPQYRVTGRLLNDSGGTVERATVVVTLYDDEGRVIGYRQSMLASQGRASAGANVEFSVLLTYHGGAEPASFQVIAWGVRSME